MKADPRTATEVRAALDRFAAIYEQRDVESLLAMLIPDPDVTVLGSGPDERRIGLTQVREQVERDWQQSDAASVEYGWMQISACGSVAWVASDVTFSATIDGETEQFTGRLTVVLEKREETWLIAQWHFAIPPAAQEIGKSFPA
ncbi:MAG: nuclear transport factor 2 family protein [Candidatus Hydrogenedentes bacterium]|nr:nuclear transport factor 2 family protein [Candidatus Hydrogenedentota bacterium]